MSTHTIVLNATHHDTRASCFGALEIKSWGLRSSWHFWGFAETRSWHGQDSESRDAASYPLATPKQRHTPAQSFMGVAGDPMPWTTRHRSLSFVVMLPAVSAQSMYVCSETGTSTFVAGSHTGEADYSVSPVAGDDDCLTQALSTLQGQGHNPPGWFIRRHMIGAESCSLIQSSDYFCTTASCVERYRACKIICPSCPNPPPSPPPPSPSPPR